MHSLGYLEPWLRGIRADANPVAAHLLRASQQIREDCALVLSGASTENIWAQPHGCTSAGFHAKHLAGSTHRLCTYLADASLTEADLKAGSLETLGTESAGELIAAIERALTRYENLVQALHPERFGEIRHVGRKRIEVTAVSLAIHIAEHGQRHTGQLISALKLAAAAASRTDGPD